MTIRELTPDEIDRYRTDGVALVEQAVDIKWVNVKPGDAPTDDNVFPCIWPSS